MVATDCGGCRLKADDVNPGNGGRNPLCSAALRVDKVDENRAEWWKATKSAGRAEPMAVRQMGFSGNRTLHPPGGFSGTSGNFERCR
jgi:hypothetical protein